MAQHSNKLKVSLISALMVMGLAAGPVQADHNDYNGNVIVPLATVLVLGSLLRHNHGHAHKYSKRRYGHYGHGGHYGHQHSHRARSYSHEGYNHKSRRNSHQARSNSHEGYNRKSKRN